MSKDMQKRSIHLPVCGIKIELEEWDEDEGRAGFGSISSNLHDTKCVFCGQDPCPKDGNCDESQDADTDKLNAEIEQERANFACHTIESIILAHAVAGVDVEDPAYLEGIETAVDAIANNL